MAAVAMAIGAATTAGSALAAASPASPPPAEQVSAMVTKNPQQAAKQLQRLHDQMKSSFDARDVAGVQQASRGVEAALGALQTRDTQWNLQGQTVQRVEKATQQNKTLAGKLDAMAAPQVEQGALPPLPPPLDSISALVQSLLANLQGIVNGLLPTGAPSAPSLPGAPGLPGAPSLPGAPELPAPGVPGLPTP